MSFNRLRSHEDLSDYLDVLNDVYDSFDDPSNLIPSFSQDPHEVVQDLLSQLINTRKKGLEIIKIARKFYKAQSDSAFNNQNLVKEILSLQSEINTLVSKVSSQSKEIDTKDDRISTMSHELHETEKEYRGLLIEVEQLRKNLKILKERKISPKVKQRTSLLKVREDNEEQIKSLNVMIEDFKDELLRKAAEIDELNLKVKSLEDEVVAERINADKSKVLANGIKKENFDLSDRIEELEYQLEAKKSQVLRLEHELIHEKSHGENIIKQYERERSVSIASNFGTNSEFISIRSNFGTNNEFFSISSNFGTNNEPIKLDGDPDSKEKSQNLPTYKKNAPKMETLGDWMDEENDYVEDIRPKPMLSKQPTMFVLSSPVVNYDRKFQFPDLKQKDLDIEKGEQISIIQKKKNSANPTFDLKKRMKKKVFTFDDDENHDNITPLQGDREAALSIQAFKGLSGKNILRPEKNFELEICQVGGMSKFCEPRSRNWKLGVEKSVNGKIEVKAKMKPKLYCKIGERIGVHRKVQNIGKTVLAGFRYKGICKSVLQESEVSVKRSEKFKLSAFSQLDMNISCKPQSKKVLALIKQKHSTVNIKPSQKPKLNEIRENSLSISPKLAKISLCFPKGISIKQFCTTSSQETHVSIKKSKKLYSLCAQPKMSTLCLPEVKNKRFRIEKKFDCWIEVRPKEKNKLLETFENSLGIISKVQKIEACLIPGIMLKSNCNSFIQGSGILISSKPKTKLSASCIVEMNILCKAQIKNQLALAQQRHSNIVIKPLQKPKLNEIMENSLTIRPKISKISLCVTNIISLKNVCSTSIQENHILIKNPKKLFKSCKQPKMSLFCEPKLKNKNLKIEKIFNGKVEIKEKAKVKLFITFESTLEIIAKPQKMEVSLAPGFMLKSTCKTCIQGAGISVSKKKKFKLSASRITEMNMHCKPQSKNPLLLIQEKHSSVNIKPLQKPKLNEAMQNSLAINPKIPKLSLCITKNLSIKHLCSTSIQEDQILIQKPIKLFSLCFQLKMSTFCEPKLRSKQLKIEKIIHDKVELKPKLKPKLFNTLESTLGTIAKVQEIEVSLVPGFMYKSECKTSLQESKISIKKLKKFNLAVAIQEEMIHFCNPNPKPQLQTRSEFSLSLPRPLNSYTMFTYSFKKPSTSLSTSSLQFQSIEPYPRPTLKLQQEPSFFIRTTKKRFYITIESTLGIPKQSINLNLSSFRSLSTIKPLNLVSQNSLKTFPLLKNRNLSVSKQFSEEFKKSTQKVDLEITGSYSRFCNPKVCKEFSSKIQPQKMGLLEIEVQNNVFIEQKIKNKCYEFSSQADFSVAINRPMLALGCYPGSQLKKKLSVFIDPVMNYSIINRKVVVLTEQKVQNLGLISKKEKKLQDVHEFHLGILAKPKNCKVKNYGVLSISPKKRLLQVSVQITQRIDTVKPNIVFEAVQSLNKNHYLGISECYTIGITKLKKTKLRVKRQKDFYIEKKEKNCGWSQTDEIIEKFVARSFIISSKLQILPQRNSFLIKSPEKFLTLSKQGAITLPKKKKTEASSQISYDLLTMIRNQLFIIDTQLPITVFPDKTENSTIKNPIFPPKNFSLSIQSLPLLFVKISERPQLKYSTQDSLEIPPSTANSSQISEISLTNHSIYSLNKSWVIVSAPDISVKRLRKNLEIINTEQIVLNGLKGFKSTLGTHPNLNIQFNSCESLQIMPNKPRNEKAIKQNREFDICKIYSMMLIPSYSVLKGSGRESKMDFGSQRDPIKDFFIMICQSIKLNSLQKDKIGVIPIDDLYRKVLQDKIPFNKWYSYLKQHFISRISIRKNP